MQVSFFEIKLRMPNNLGREKNDMYQGISTNFKLPTHGILYHDYGGVHKSTYIPCNITAGGVAKVNGQEVAGCFFISLSFVYPPEDIVSIHPGLLHRAHERNPSILDILVLTPMAANLSL